MELFRYSRDVYGQQILEGVSWDLFYIVVGLAAVAIVGHLIFKVVTDKKKAA
jgi:formate dehydrogenase subunit gamma|tara:strand:- start:833 stop:988 length:156 start_codon:yes stop_codon:yes gene_type:complete